MEASKKREKEEERRGGWRKRWRGRSKRYGEEGGYLKLKRGFQDSLINPHPYPHCPVSLTTFLFLSFFLSLPHIFLPQLFLSLSKRSQILGACRQISSVCRLIVTVSILLALQRVPASDPPIQPVSGHCRLVPTAGRLSAVTSSPPIPFFHHPLCLLFTSSPSPFSISSPCPSPLQPSHVWALLPIFHLLFSIVYFFVHSPSICLIFIWTLQKRK